MEITLDVPTMQQLKDFIPFAVMAGSSIAVVYARVIYDRLKRTDKVITDNSV